MNLIETTSEISKKFKRKIILFRYPERAWQLMTTIATGKPRTVTLKTARNGPLSGLIPVEAGVSFPDEFSFAEHDNNGVVLAYNGNFITSDLDILWIERKNGEKIIFDQELGYLTALEKKIIGELNATFRKFCGRNVTLITHGPYFNLKKPKRSDIVFPYDGFHPVLGHNELKNEDQLKKFSRELHVIDEWTR